VIAGATQTALEPMTPGALDDAVRELVLDPSVSASLVDAGTRALLTSAAARRVEVAKRIVIGQGGAAPLLTLVDDPTTRGAYGGFQFDDEGEPAAPVTLIEGGRVAAVLADRAGGGRGRGRRPGHVGVVEPGPSHLRLAHGDAPHESLRSDGVILEGGIGAVIDPSTNRIVIGAARARETKAGKLTGRVYADVELVGDLGALLGGVTGVAQEVGVTAYRDEVDGEPRWRSIEAPYLRTRGLVRSRRRRA
jgi:predicted Zn-dependent protease